MSKQLENFAEQNRSAFDDYEPSIKVWDKLQLQLNKNPAIVLQKGVVKKLAFYKWVAAASVALLLGISIFMYSKYNLANHAIAINTLKIPVLHNLVKPVDTAIKNNNSNDFAKQQKDIQKIDADRPTQNKETILPKEKDDDEGETIAFNQTQKYFAKIIAYKEKEIKTLATTNPLMYKDFKSDIKNLSSDYKKLNEQLPRTQNKAALINAMIYNLQIQIDLLNKQLIILNKIESSQKKEKYENNI